MAYHRTKTEVNQLSRLAFQLFWDRIRFWEGLHHRRFDAKPLSWSWKFKVWIVHIVELSGISIEIEVWTADGQVSLKWSFKRFTLCIPRLIAHVHIVWYSLGSFAL